MISKFRFSGNIAQALLMTRLQYTQMLEVNGLIIENVGEEAFKSLQPIEDNYTLNMVEQAAETIRLTVLTSGLEPDQVAYFENPTNSAFPADRTGDVYNVTLEDYFQEIAEDLVTLTAIPAPDIIRECERTVGEVIDFVDVVDKD